MKHTKKLVSLLLTLVMVLSMSITAFAANDSNTNTKGKITINNAVKGETYSIYRIMDLESYSAAKNEPENPDTGAYSYKVNSAWNDFFVTDAKGAEYVDIDKNGYVSWKKDADAAGFAKEALKYAKEKTPTPVAVTASKKAESTTVTFESLDLGYYLLDTSLGSLCSLDTTNPNVAMNEKNEAPTVDKKVKEDSKTGEDVWSDSNTAQIGDTVEFKTTIHAKKGAQNYVLHDQMTKGLTLDQQSIVVKVGDASLTKDTDYKVEFNKTNCSFKEELKTCNFEIKFTETYLNSITEDKQIVVTYKAILNNEAEIYDKTNNNQTRLDYGDSSSTEWDKTETKTFQFDLVKTDSNNKVLTGAKFKLYDAETGGNEIALVKEQDGSYRIATAEEKAETDPKFQAAVIEAGKVTVKGIDVNTSYWLEETEAPAGYNKLSERVEVKITDTDENSATNLTATMNNDTWTEGGVHVVNNTGAELPSTGGIGTTIFYAAGSILVLAAAVLLITRKRMSREE